MENFFDIAALLVVIALLLWIIFGKPRGPDKPEYDDATDF